MNVRQVASLALYFMLHKVAFHLSLQQEVGWQQV